MSFESVFCMKIAGTILFVSWLAIYQRKTITENCNFVGAGAHKIGKAVNS